MKVLLSHDGSECSDRAVKFVARTLSKQVKNLRLTLVYVDIPMLDRVAAELGEETVARIHRENSDFALKGARSRLRRAGVAFDESRLIGNVAGHIIALAKKGRFDVVVMGSHGRTALKNLLLGSVTTNVMAQSKVPVLVVR
jgi:nucleotide-binding universal stress UspA family protein